ncbi:MAG: dephospho-CoA kinase, partial [Dehalococcoidales bacterium]|nr:dephospho-CoA kinase [Dehalococcoidales bacterium]
MKIIGLTGGIGSGKSTVAGLLIELGAVIIDADKIGHEVLESDSQAREQVIAAFGHCILNHDGSINRRELGRIVFADRNSLFRLNQIMHPLIYRVIKTKLEQYKEQGARVVVIEAPLLIEASWATMVDAVWVVAATEANILKRLEKTGLSRNEIVTRIRSQLTESERIKMANVVINNDYSFDELKLKVNRLWQEL